ncbi:uncharacterized protein LOC121419890 [Lytechinus variegatus]|uniref:uncharacterized protein LOC121419890 n=1 Tax=Lytechinus variegatus TaxID=7654 RepID=UPI001BB262D3|nr:uncharacterized protein LOC121419890 [Lytechinus variegatus]
MSSECTGKDLSQEQGSIKDYSQESQGVDRPHLPASIENSCDLGEERSQRCLRGSNDLACHVSVDHRSNSWSCCKFSSNPKDITQKQSHAQSESKKGFDENAHEKIDKTVDVHVPNDICKGNVSNSTVHSESLCNEQTSLKRPHVCSQCGKKFQKMLSLKVHMYTHTGKKPFECSLCPQSFNSMKQLVRHSSEQHGNEVTECRKKITSENKDIAHNEKFVTNYMQSGDTFESQSHDPGHNKSLETNQKQIHIADQEKIDITDKWEQHGKVHHEMHRQNDDILSQQGNTNSSKSTSKGLALTSISHEIPKPYGCSLCGKKFRNTSHRKEHMYTHTGKKPFECSLCPKSFCRKRKLVNHSLSIHGVLIVDQVFPGVTVDQDSLGVTVDQETPGVAVDEVSNSGNKSSEDQTEIRAHKKKISKGLSLKSRSYEIPKQLSTRPYACSQCGKRFKKNYHLKEHMDTHTGKKPFLCCICQRSFARKRAFVSHSLRAHRFSNDQLSEEGCKFFSNPKVLVYKLSIEDCLEQINSPGDKTRSLEIPKPYSCSQCERKFRQAYHLKEHMYTHTGKNDFECSLSPKSLRQRTNHVNRSLRHHGVIVDQVSHGVNVHKFSHGVIVDQDSNGVTVDQDSYGETVDQVSNSGNKSSGYQTEILSQKKPILSKGISLKSRSHEIPKPYGCSVCGKKFRNTSHRKEHMYTHTGKKPFECSLCPKSFSRKRKLVSHSLSIHGVAVDQVSPGVAVDQVSPGVAVDQVSPGVAVDQVSPGVTADQETHGVAIDQESLGVTVDQETDGVAVGQVFNSGNKSFEDETEILAQKKPISKGMSVKSRSHEIPKQLSTRPYACTQCGKSFKQNNHLKEHLYTHTGKRPFECSLCPKSFSRRTQLLNHLLRHHGISIDQECRRVIVDQVSHGLAVDQETLQVAVNQETCGVTDNQVSLVTVGQETCGATVNQVFHGVTVDPETHGVTPDRETCGVTVVHDSCGLTVDQVSQQVNVDQFSHEVTVDQVSHQVAVDQEICGVTVDQESLVTVDQESLGVTVDQERVTADRMSNSGNKSSEYQTKILAQKKPISNRISLKSRSHEILKPYGCSVCGRKFRKTTHRKEHMYTHTGKKPFECSLCPKSFSRKRNLVNHSLSIHRVAVDQESRGVAVDQETPGVTVDQGSCGVTVDQETHGVTADRETHGVTVVQVSHQVAVDQETHGVAVDQEICEVSVDQKSLVTVDQETHGVTVVHDSYGLTVDQVSQRVNVDQFSHEVAVDQETHSVIVDQETHGVTVDQVSHQVAVDQETHGVTVEQVSHQVAVDQETHGVAVDQEICEVSVDQKSLVTVDQETPGEIADRMSNSGNKSSEYQTEILTQKKPISKRISLKSRSHEIPKPYGCSVCGRKFRKTTHRKEHMYTHTGKKPFECSLCPKSFSRKRNLVNHSVRIHRVAVDQESRGVTVDQDSHGVAIDEESLGIAVDQVSNSGNKSSEDQTEILAQKKKIIKGLSLKSRSHDIPKNISTRPYACTQCGKRFKRTCHLKEHMYTHTGKKPFECSLCPKSFSRKRNLVNHSLRDHGIAADQVSRERTVDQESNCEKQLIDSNQKDISDQDNMQISHDKDCTGHNPSVQTNTDTLNYVCSCGESFHSFEQLTVHTKTVGGGEPMKCPNCDEVFCHRSSYICHILMHLEKNHKCPECEQTFRWSYELTAHMKSHLTKSNENTNLPTEFRRGKKLIKACSSKKDRKYGSYVCSQCNKHFKKSSCLREHIAIFHTREKYLSCSKCSSSFIKRKSLIWHSAKYHGVVLDQICECGKGFSSKAEVIAHITTHDTLQSQGLGNHQQTHGTAHDQRNSNEKVSNKVFHNSYSNMSLVETQTSFKEPQLNKEMSEKTRSIAMTKDLFDDSDDDQMSISSELIGRCTKSDESSSVLTVVDTHRKNGQESSLEELSAQTVDERLCSCSECQQIFSGKISLLQHLMRHHEDILNKVCECGKRFASEEALSNHQRGLVKCNKCPICKKTFEGQCLYELHMEMHAEMQYKCTECEDKFALENQLINHLKFHTGGKPFACSMCKASFSQDNSLAEHLQMHKKENLYECVKCGILFVNENEICKHERKEHKHCWCPVCGKHCYASKEYEEHMQTHKEDPSFECLKCHKQYPHLESLKRHAPRHDERKILKCLSCDKLFTRESLRKHVKWHRSIRPHKCIQCGKGYIGRQELKKHIIRVHTPALHLCHICGRAFVSEARLLIHVESVHKKQEFHTCPDCGYSVANKQLLSQHLYICRGGKPYKCTICQDLFSDKYELNRHIKKHAGKKQCPVCKRQFKSIYDANLHVRRVHTGERPFQCSQCPATFLGSSDLRAHMRWHSGVKRFKCPLCRKAFITTTGRNRHLKRVHKEVNYMMCDKCGERFSGFDELLNHRKRLYKETPHLCVVCENRYQTICELTVHLKTHSNKHETMKS